MFRQARIKLTLWYLAIIMLVSLTFSGVIYGMISMEVERFDQAQRSRIEHCFLEGEFCPPGVRWQIPSPPTRSWNPELISETKHRLLMVLMVVNGGILVLAGGLGYMLAGRTLKPIQEMLDEQNQFIGDASHELRTPLTSLKSTMEVSLRDKELTLKDAKQLIKESLEEVNKMQILSDSLLQLAQYQEHNGQNQLKMVSLAEVIDKAVAKIRPMAKVKEVNIKVNTQDYKLKGNDQRLGELFTILLDNAVKYSPAGKEITVANKQTDGRVITTVTDQGIGIAKKDLPHVFDRFYRADTARLRSGSGGYGLGLAIAKKIVEDHQGTIRVKSQVGSGSTFFVSLPVVRKPIE